MPKKTNESGYALPPASEILKPEDVLHCTCGSAGFFDWGVSLRIKAKESRVKEQPEVALGYPVLICVECQTPVLDYYGHYYDASDFVPSEAVNSLLDRSRMPQKVMDP